MELDQVEFPELQRPTVLKKRLAECYTYSLHRASKQKAASARTVS